MRKASTIRSEMNKAHIELDAKMRAVFALVGNRTDVRFCDIVAKPEFAHHIAVIEYDAQLAYVDDLRAELRSAGVIAL